MRAHTGVLAAALTAAVGGPATADSWKQESRFWGLRDWHAPVHYYAARPGRHEWKAGGCKYEVKVEHGVVREKYKCKGGPYRTLLPPQAFAPWGIAPGPYPVRYVLGPELALAPEAGYCREYQQQVLVGGRWEQAYGTACRRPDGSWQIVE